MQSTITTLSLDKYLGNMGTWKQMKVESRRLIIIQRYIFIVLYWTCLPNEMTNYWHPCGSCILSNKFLVILSHFFKNWSSHSSCFQPLFDFLHFLCTSENKMKRGSCRHETKAASSDTRCHLLGCDSEWSKGIFEKAKGLLMNRLFIDPWTNSR